MSGAVYALERAAELLRAREVAESASAAKSDFVAVMSHEVRTPLTAILGHLDLCLQTRLTREQRAHLNQARASSNALLRIVSDVLDFSKIEAERLTLEEVPFELEEVLCELVGTCSLPAARKGLEFVFDVAADVPGTLTGDPLRLTQVLLNLVGNAIKFSHQGHVVLRVERLANQQDRVRLRFSVSDTGIGMSPEQLATAFDPFTQGDGSMTRRYGGTGLGLTISRRLVALMGGELVAVTELDRGSEFSFHCSFSERKVPSVLAGAELELGVLVVEHDELQAGALCRALKSLGCTSRAVHNAAEALAAQTSPEKRAAFDVVFVDPALADSDGLELVERMRDAAD